MSTHASQRFPGPPSWTFLKNLRDFKKSPLSFLTHMYQNYGDLVGLRLGPWPCALVSSPDLARELLVKRREEFPLYRKIFGLISPLTGKQGLVQLDGESWLSM